MGRTFGAVATVMLALTATTAVIGNTVFRSALHDYRVVTVVDGLVQPWSIAFLPGGDALITERPGRLRILRQGKLLPQPVEGVPKVFHSSQGGLLEVMPHPAFASNRLIYLSFSKPGATDAQATTTLIRGRFDGTALTGVEQLLEAATQGRNHFGGKIAFDGNGYLYLTLGDRQVAPEGNLEAHPAQDLSNHHGKMIRLHDDGRVPSDNPFVNRAGARPEIWSYGHRNVQGLAIHPQTGDIWTNEHGPQGGDELNLVQPGLNYGWPVIGYGVNYQTGLAIHAGYAPSGHGATCTAVGPLDRHLRSDVLYRRPLSGVARQSVRRRHGAPAAGPADARWAACHQRRGARAADGPRQGHQAGAGGRHLPGHRQPRGEADTDPAAGTGNPGAGEVAEILALVPATQRTSEQQAP